MVPLWLCLWMAAASASVLADTGTAPAPPAASNGNGKSQLWNATWTDRLKHDMLMKYDKFARPAQHTNVTEVQFTLNIKHVEIDEVRSMMVINAWTSLTWEDEKLRWNASDYAGLAKLTVGDHEIWQPDIVLYNSAATSLDHYANTHCLVYNNGKVLWVPPSQFSVYCNLNLRKWPYDAHTCYFFFGSWVYDGEQITLKRPPNKILEHSEMEPSEWTVLSVTEMEHVKYYNCCTEPYYSIEVVVTVQRHSPGYTAVVFTPAFVCVLLTLAVFWLPPAASEKFLLSGATCVISSMFLIYFAHRLPAMAANTPIIVQFYSYNLLLVCVSVMVSVVTVSLSRRPRSHGVPWILMKLLRSRLVYFLALPHHEYSTYPRQESEELHERCLVDRDRTESVDTTATQPSLSNNKREWTILASAIDRIMFLIYLLAFIFMIISFYLF